MVNRGTSLNARVLKAEEYSPSLQENDPKVIMLIKKANFKVSLDTKGDECTLLVGIDYGASKNDETTKYFIQMRKKFYDLNDMNKFYSSFVNTWYARINKLENHSEEF